VLLAAIAMATERIRLGTMLTALSRRRPWQLAGEVATLDRLSDGRAILSLGLGAADDLGFARVGEATDRKVRAELLDEGIELLTRFWSGQPFTFDGVHYHVDWDARHAYTPGQQPRVPIWVVGAWPRQQSMRRVLRCDGLIPSKMTPEGAAVEITPDDRDAIRAMQAFVAAQRTLTTPFDIVLEGDTPGDDREKAIGIVGPLAEVGVTWWLESAAVHNRRGGLDAVRTRMRQGPPRLMESS
jgi:alkanesulfonate monooxygenase SsuD/methylene tetrahydromethanopterin reductase-like flavin-dependent oxidoreductase (luciferase family)